MEEKELVEAARAHGGADCVAAYAGRSMRGQAAQEYAEDAVSCFRASGECVFDLEAIQTASAKAGPGVESTE